MITERRQYTRKALTVAVTLDIDGTIIRGSECRNISQGGMFIALKQDIAINKQGTVTLTTKCGSELITFRSEFQVVRCVYPGEYNGDKGIGVTFTRMDDASNQNLFRILAFSR